MPRRYSAWLRSSGDFWSPFESFGFVTGIDNFLCDALSRDIAIADLGIGGLVDFGPYLSSTLLKALEFCDPHLDTTSDEGFFEYWDALRVFLNTIVVASQDDCATMLGGVSAATEYPNNSRLTAL